MRPLQLSGYIAAAFVSALVLKSAVFDKIIVEIEREAQENQIRIEKIIALRQRVCRYIESRKKLEFMQKMIAKLAGMYGLQDSVNSCINDLMRIDLSNDSENVYRLKREIRQLKSLAIKRNEIK